MPQQIPLIPVSPHELTHAAFRLAELMAQDEEEDETFEEARKAHKETKAVYRKAMGEQRATIRRAQLEQQEGLTRNQVDALLAQAAEAHE